MTNNALTLGPLLLPYAVLLVFAAAGIGMLVGRRVGKRNGVDVEGTLWNAMLVGAVVARLAFVLEYKTLYFSSPLSIINIRDGGWNATAALAGMRTSISSSSTRARSAPRLRVGCTPGSCNRATC
ncbi:prolipoprotein diacylglyceryl transferase [Comamonadaceae bacterium G21597-S1]|nr:prolipoprotein diacylglyceryl transferase [Comamonadaceae bacterium G21597-S1]